MSPLTSGALSGAALSSRELRALEPAEIQSRIRAFIVDEILFGEQVEMAIDDSLLERGIIDSTGLAELVTFLQESFAISIDDDELTRANLDSIGRMATLVARKRAAG